jgi:hypothetical protein
MLAKGDEKLGRIDEGLALLDEMLTRIERSSERLDEAELYRVKGELIDASNPSARPKAETCFGKGVELAHPQGSQWWGAARYNEPRAGCRKSKANAPKRAMLAEIYGWFSEGFDTADLKEAKELLDELETSCSARSARQQESPARDSAPSARCRIPVRTVIRTMHRRCAATGHEPGARRHAILSGPVPRTELHNCGTPNLMRRCCGAL